MNEVAVLVAAFFAGSALGAVFFGGLWWTVQKGLGSQHPALWFFGSMIMRMGITLVGFYMIGGMVWQRWLVCLAGFVLARFVVNRLTVLPMQARPS